MKKQSQADKILSFLSQLQPSFKLPPGIDLMHPMKDAETWKLMDKFYRLFYTDCEERVLVFGINPGRFGGGVTGIPFTDPLKLEKDCGIENDFKKKTELSAEFVYQVVYKLGGPVEFYKKFFITAVCPLGFVKSGKNLNYYDDRELQKNATPFILDCIRQQLASLEPADYCFCLGEGANYKYLKKLNEEYDFFREIIPLPHPRWVMQYRRKQLPAFIELYAKELNLIRK